MMLPAHLDDVTPRSPTTLIEQCLAHINSELAALAESMRALRSHKNSLARISSLPPEILATVFRHIVTEENSKKFTGVYRRPPCLLVTHVCRHWRRVALECPGLWAYIIWTSARWISLMLERSKDAALVVACHPLTLPRDCLGQVLSQLPRIKVLLLYLYRSDVDHALDHLSFQPAPLLQRFRLSVMRDGSHETLWPVSDTIFQVQAHQLRRLELTGCDFSWTSHIFSGLRTLHVQGMKFSSTLPELLLALRRMPDLEQLTLERLSIAPEGHNVLFDRVPLARLQSIVLSASIQTAVTLFAHLALPNDTKIALDLIKVEGLQSFSDLFLAMDKGPGKFGLIFQSLRANLSSLWSVVQFSTSMECEVPNSWKASNDDVRLSIRFHWDASVAIEPTIIFDICQMVTQDTIHGLSVSSSVSLDESFWRTGSGHLPELEELHVSSSSIGGLFLALQTLAVTRSAFAYPSLHVLDLSEIGFLDDDPQDIHTIVVMRRGVCDPLNVLRLTDCKGLMADDVEVLEEVIEDVDWDGIEEALESESQSESEPWSLSGARFRPCPCSECRDPDEP